MKIYVFRRNALIFYSLMGILFITLLLANSNDAVSVSSLMTGRVLPIYSVERDGKTVSITFDAAWEDTDVADIINILKKYNVRATFFVTGDFVDRCSASVKALHDSGHEIANHSDQHPHPNKLSADALRTDTLACDKKIRSVTGSSVPLYRSPYGEYNDNVVKTINSMGYHFIQWDVDSLDYKDLTAEKIAERVLKRVKPGSIVLFHVGTKNTVKALPKVLEKLTADGYTFLTAGEIIYKDNYYIDHTGRQFPKQKTITTID